MNNNLSDTPRRRGRVIGRIGGAALLSVVALVLAIGMIVEGVAAFATSHEDSMTRRQAMGTDADAPGHGFNVTKLQQRGALVVGEVRRAAAVATSAASAASAIDKSRFGSLVALSGHARKHPQKALAAVLRPPGGLGDRAVFFALAKVGVPYRNRATGPNSFDCSGLTMAAYQQLGIALPHRASLQARLGAAVDWRTHPLRPGDLIFTRGGRPRHNLGHVGIANLGPGVGGRPQLGANRDSRADPIRPDPGRPARPCSVALLGGRNLKRCDTSCEAVGGRGLTRRRPAGGFPPRGHGASRPRALPVAERC